jgi:hypothetical protein
VSEKPQAAKTRANEFAESELDGEAADVVEAIKAMQIQLADLRRLVQAAKIPGDNPGIK